MSIAQQDVPLGEVKIGDVGTVYFVPTYDDDRELTNFDPSSATTKQLVFRMQGASALLMRTATAVQQTIGGVDVWGLAYTVTAADVAPYDAQAQTGGFHQQAGPISIEGYLEFSPSQKWTSSTVTKDLQGRPLKVVGRLSV
jgi:hypothetical protein